MECYFFNRFAEPGTPAGITVSKNPELPAGDFRITEYKWPQASGYPRHVSLWFIAADKFTANERQRAFEAALADGETATNKSN